jgi:hypothetical protein
MYVAYIDESGCTGVLPHSASPIQPLLVVGAIFIDAGDLPAITRDFLDIKGRFYPLLMPAGRPLDRVLVEIKGADLRTDIRSRHRSHQRTAIGFLDQLMGLLEAHHVRVVARVWIKGIGAAMTGKSVYTASVQAIYRYFQSYVTGLNDRGIVIADGRSKTKNVNVAHSIFTQKFQQAGDEYNRILEMPTFGNSENHATLQIVDLLCSAVIFPIAAYSYCLGHVNNVHVSANYRILKDRYGRRLLPLQYRYQDIDNRWQGGIVVSDALQRRSSVLMFR